MNQIKQDKYKHQIKEESKFDQTQAIDEPPLNA
jgi:hypothetical protein